MNNIQSSGTPAGLQFNLLEFNFPNFQLLDSYLSDWLTFIIKSS